jgi:hypothetical protein
MLFDRPVFVGAKKKKKPRFWGGPERGISWRRGGRLEGAIAPEGRKKSLEETALGLVLDIFPISGGPVARAMGPRGIGKAI